MTRHKLHNPCPPQIFVQNMLRNDLIICPFRANMCTTERENTKKTEDAGMKVWTLGKFEEMEIGQNQSLKEKQIEWANTL